MKTFTNNGNIESYDIVHMKGDKDKYILTENNGKLTYASASVDRTYILDAVEEIGFQYANANGTKFKWDDEFSPFNIKASCQAWLDSGATTDGVYMIDAAEHGSFEVYCDMTTDGGGWTLVSSASLDNRNHFGSTVNTNLASSGALIPLDYAGRKFNDAFTQYLLNNGEGVFKVQVDNKRFTSFVKVDNNNAFSFNATGGSNAPYRMWVSYAYNNGSYNWEARDTNIGYRFGGNDNYKVFDSHDDAEGGSNWYASEYTEQRILWGYTGNSSNGVYDSQNGLMWIR